MTSEAIYQLKYLAPVRILFTLVEIRIQFKSPVNFSIPPGQRFNDPNA